MGQVDACALSLTNVSKSYGRVRALHNLSFSVAEGRFFVLFGPSSVGKTTTLRTIAGLVMPDRGRVEIFGRDWTHAPIAARGVSMVFQSFALYPHLTVYENFAYPLREAKVATRGDRHAGQGDRGDAAARTRLERKPNTLSGGEQQRVALGRSLIRRPQHPAARRAADQSRRQAAPRHARRAQAPASPVRHDDRLCDARRARGAVDGRGDRRACATARSCSRARPTSSTKRRAISMSPRKIGSPHMNLIEGTLARDGSVIDSAIGAVAIARAS